MFDMQVDPNWGIFTSIIDGDRSVSQTDYNIYDPIIQKEITTLLYAGKYHKIMNLIWSIDMNKHKTPSKGLQLLVAKKPSVRSLLDLENSLKKWRAPREMTL